MPDSVELLYHPDFLSYDFGAQHPLRPERITAGIDLLQGTGLWAPDPQRHPVQPATVTDLEAVHDARYILTVEALSDDRTPRDNIAQYGFASSDNPPFPNMHLAASLITGGTVEGMRNVMSGKVLHAFNPAGGWHHAHRARASGFCIYNDGAVAAALAEREFGARVLYLDFDCHHGDGVQSIFYNDPNVYTVSFHESGRFLFPGTGEGNEIGAGKGKGYALNLAFAPYTDDEDWQEALSRLLPPLAAAFRPDLILSNHGADTHLWDPLTHLALSTGSFVYQARLAHRLAHEYAGGRWLAVGSGGYDWRRVVPRSWSIIWAEMSEAQLPAQLPLPWSQRWLSNADGPVPVTFLDDPAAHRSHRSSGEVREWNRGVIAAAESTMRSGGPFLATPKP